MIYLRAKYHRPVFSRSLPSNQQLNIDFMLPPFGCFALQKNLIKVSYLSKIYCHASFRDSILNNTSIAFTSQVRASAMLLKYEIRVDCNGGTFIPNFVKFVQLVQTLKWEHVESMVIS
jgi:hypothetical protein